MLIYKPIMFLRMIVDYYIKESQTIYADRDTVA